MRNCRRRLTAGWRRGVTAVTAAEVLATAVVGDVGGGRFALLSELQTVRGTVISVRTDGTACSR